MSRGSHRASVRCLRQTTASMACSCPIHLSASGKPSDPETFLQVPPNCVGDTTKRHTAHYIRSPRWLRLVSAAVDPSMQIPEILIQALPVVLPRHPVHPRRGFRADSPESRP